MSLFSNDIRVANTATPSFQQQANVGQFGWTGADQGHYNQLIQYVDECRKIWLGLESKIEYVENLLLEIADIDEQVRYVTLKANEVAEDARQTTVDVSRTALLYTQVKGLSDNVDIKYVDFNLKYDDFFTKYPVTVQAATDAKASEVGAKDWYDKSKDLYDDLKEGQVYRGIWNPKVGAYPDNQGTNSVWDVILDDGVLEVDFSGHKWRSGDRLLYVVSSTEYQRLATGSGVASINGETGAVTLTAAKVGALGKTDNAVSATKLATPRKIAGVAFDGTGDIVLTSANVNAVPSDRKINNKYLNADITLSPADVGAVSLSGGTMQGMGEIHWPNNNASLLSRDNQFVSLEGGTHVMVTTGRHNADGAAYVGRNFYYENGWKKFNDAKDSAVLEVTGSGMTFFQSDAGSDNVIQKHSKVYHEGFKPTAAELGVVSVGNAREDALSDGGFYDAQSRDFNTLEAGFCGLIPVYGSSNTPPACTWGDGHIYVEVQSLLTNEIVQRTLPFRNSETTASRVLNASGAWGGWLVDQVFRYIGNGADINNYHDAPNFGSFSVSSGDTSNWPWNNISPGTLVVDGVHGTTRQQAWRTGSFDTVVRLRDGDGNWSAWQSVYNAQYFPKRDSWENFAESRELVVGSLAWSQYGNGHVIFDSSKGISPTGVGVDRKNATIPWRNEHPTLMGWNGSDTYGVRVDSARIADTVVTVAATAVQVTDPRTKKEENLMEVIASLVSRIEELEAKLK